MNTCPRNKQDDAFFWALSMAFTVLLILSNTIANRLISVGGLLLPSAIIIFPLTYIIGDIVTEIYGFRKTKNLIATSLFLNCIFVGLGVFAVSLPAPSDASNISSYSEVFNVTPRIALASICSFFIGSLTNAFVMDKMKKKKSLQAFLFFRIFTSTIIGEFFDTCLFIIIAFVGLLDINILATMIIIQFISKVAYETVFSPLTIVIAKNSCFSR